MRLPSSEIDDWITSQIDQAHRRPTGPGWKWRAQGGLDLTECLSQIAVKKYGAFFAPTEEYVYAKRAADALGMTQSDFLRMCVGEWLLAHTDTPRDAIPTLTKHVDHRP